MNLWKQIACLLKQNLFNLNPAFDLENSRKHEKTPKTFMYLFKTIENQNIKFLENCSQSDN